MILTKDDLINALYDLRTAADQRVTVAVELDRLKRRDAELAGKIEWAYSVLKRYLEAQP